MMFIHVGTDTLSTYVKTTENSKCHFFKRCGHLTEVETTSKMFKSYLNKLLKNLIDFLYVSFSCVTAKIKLI